MKKPSIKKEPVKKKKPKKAKKKVLAGRARGDHFTNGSPWQRRCDEEEERSRH